LFTGKLPRRVSSWFLANALVLILVTPIGVLRRTSTSWFSPPGTVFGGFKAGLVVVHDDANENLVQVDRLGRCTVHSARVLSSCLFGADGQRGYRVGSQGCVTLTLQMPTRCAVLFN